MKSSQILFLLLQIIFGGIPVLLVTFLFVYTNFLSFKQKRKLRKLYKIIKNKLFTHKKRRYRKKANTIPIIVLLFMSLFLLSCQSIYAMKVSIDSAYAAYNPETVECHDTPTPTVTPTPDSISTPSATPTPQIVIINQASSDTHSDGKSSNADATLAHTDMCTIQIKPPVNPVFLRIAPTKVSFSWWKSLDTTQFQDIEYGYGSNNLSYGVILPSLSTSYTIAGLSANKTIFAKICAFNHGCKACTQVIDP